MNYVDFDLNLLKIFVEVFESGGIVSASKRLFISQPAVTMSIKKIENIVGDKLFFRLPKGVKPTEKGIAFYDYCKKALRQIELGVEEVASHDNQKAGKLNIGASHDLINYFLVPKIVEFAKKFPNIEIRFTETIPKHLSKYIERGDIDIAFLEEEKLGNNFENQEIAKFENCFFANQSNKKTCDIEAIKKQKIAIFKQNTANFKSFEQILENICIFEPSFQVSNFDTMCSLVDSNLCIGFAPQNYVDKNKYQIISTDFDIMPTKIYMCHLKKDETSFACKEFAKMF